MSETEVQDPINFTPHEDIGVAVLSFELLNEIDFALLHDIDKAKIENVKSMCIKIICAGITEIYYSNFYGEADT